MNLWQNFSVIIDWFKDIQQKSLYTFTVYDIPESFPSVTEKLLKNALDFAQRHIEIKQNNLDLIFHTRKSEKRKGKWRIWCYNGKQRRSWEVRVVGLFLLYGIGEKLNKDEIGFYRDDGLTCFKNNNGHQKSEIRNQMEFKKSWLLGHNIWP